MLRNKGQPVHPCTGVRGSYLATHPCCFTPMWTSFFCGLERGVKKTAPRVVPKRGEPKIWFDSLKPASEILSDSNRELLKMIVEEKPQSYQELADMTGRKPSNPGRNLKTLGQYGIVDIKRKAHAKMPVAKTYNFDIQARMPG